MAIVLSVLPFTLFLMAIVKENTMAIRKKRKGKDRKHNGHQKEGKWKDRQQNGHQKEG
jgi:hypothetical protein